MLQNGDTDEFEKTSKQDVSPGVSNRKLCLALVLLVFVTWLLPATFALRNTTLGNEDSGAIIVVFPPTYSSDEIFSKILRAHGSLLRSTRFDTVWVVASSSPGFVARLKAQGAWVAFDTILLDPVALLSCFSAFPRQG